MFGKNLLLSHTAFITDVFHNVLLLFTIAPTCYNILKNVFSNFPQSLQKSDGIAKTTKTVFF
jgi:hypothetical protein